MPDVPSDRARWKRVKSAILVGMLRELEARGVALGRPWKRATMVVHEEHAGEARALPPGAHRPSIDRALQDQAASQAVAGRDN